MQRIVYSLCVFVSLFTLIGCGTYTRVEKDIYTITEADTTVAERVTNQPGDRDNGVIYPSSRTLTTSRKMVQRDSIAERTYPNFIRLGLIESIGTIGSSINGAPSTNTGIFGLFHDLDETFFDADKDTSKSRLFSGEIYRLGITEWRLRVFDEDPGWSWGITAFEFIRPDDGPNHTLMGAGVLSLKKRFYFKNTIPYLAVAPFFSVAMAPSTYTHFGATADIGSIGGVNLRMHAGGVWGVPTAFVFKNALFFPYVGLGISVFDFLNREEELSVEWKYHEHSAWDLSIADAIIVASNVEDAFLSTRDTTSKPVLSGIVARALSASIALPVLDYRLTLGTSLATFFGLGLTEFALGILPLRASYIWHPFQTDLVIEPFVEGAFAPSRFVHAGFRAQMALAEEVSLILQGGFVNGSTGSNAAYRTDGRRPSVITDDPRAFSAVYFGFGLAVFDRMFSRKDLRYGKGYPHE